MNTHEYIAEITHDLRTPLTSIKGYLQLLDRTPLTETQQNYVSVVREKADRIQELINDFHALSYWTSESAMPAFARIGLCEILTDCFFGAERALKMRGIEPEADFPAAPVYVWADEDLLARTIQNLIANAVRHGERYLRVLVEVEPEPEPLPDKGRVRVVFENGLPCGAAPDPEKVFRRFYSEDASRSERRSGLGLAIAKTFVEKMEGDIRAEVAGDRFAVVLRLRKIA
ncbi:MAG: HAMP domain-containing histidine kinase [Clostridiales Family XIII bacterium]|jgi:signal transduction histidine kinase|nr:HAMP domain-containing histidine kinase [Clostridiales Family XIII bacterium]